MDPFIIWLLEQMEHRGWTQRELARRAGVSHSAINFILNGKHRPTWFTLRNIASALTVPLSEVLQAAGIEWPDCHERQYDLETWEIAERCARLPEGLRSYLLEIVRHLEESA